MYRLSLSGDELQRVYCGSFKSIVENIPGSTDRRQWRFLVKGHLGASELLDALLALAKAAAAATTAAAASAEATASATVAAEAATATATAAEAAAAATETATTAAAAASTKATTATATAALAACKAWMNEAQKQVLRRSTRSSEESCDNKNQPRRHSSRRR